MTDNITLTVKYNDSIKNEEFNKELTLGDIQEEILSSRHLIIYGLQYLKGTTKKGMEIIFGSEKAQFSKKLSEILTDDDIKILEVVPRFRDKDGNVEKDNPIIAAYQNYQQEKRDREMAMQMQNDYNYSRYMGVSTNTPVDQQVEHLIASRPDL